MAGFPIVSIGSMTSNAAFVDGVVNNSFIVAPQFELDEYFSGNKTSLDNYYRIEKYANFSANIESITVNPNNMEVVSGEMTSALPSLGFRHFDCYSNGIKVQGIETFRMDSFYAIKIDSQFIRLETAVKTNIVEKTYLNLPNLLLIGKFFNMKISLKLYNIYLNIPKCNSIGSHFLNQNKIIYNFYINANQNLNLGSDNFGWVTDSPEIIVNSLNNVDSLVKKLSNSVNNSGTSPTSVSFSAGNICTLDAFDLRYWTPYENETGLDVGLLEGSNLR